MKENDENAIVSATHRTTQSDSAPQAKTDMAFINPIGIVGSVDPIGITPDSPSVPSGQPFSLTLMLNTAPTSFNTVDAYILPASGSSAPVNSISAEDISIVFNNVAVHVHTTGTSATANPVLMHLVVSLVPNQKQQHIRLPAPIVTTSGQYIVSVLGHDKNNNPTNGVSTTITVHP